MILRVLDLIEMCM